jgi:hypothetical protein
MSLWFAWHQNPLLSDRRTAHSIVLPKAFLPNPAYASQRRIAREGRVAEPLDILDADYLFQHLGRLLGLRIGAGRGESQPHAHKTISRANR